VPPHVIPTSSPRETHERPTRDFREGSTHPLGCGGRWTFLHHLRDRTHRTSPCCIEDNLVHPGGSNETNRSYRERRSTHGHRQTIDRRRCRKNLPETGLKALLETRIRSDTTVCRDEILRHLEIQGTRSIETRRFAGLAFDTLPRRHDRQGLLVFHLIP